jgi:hypothetical protein
MSIANQCSPCGPEKQSEQLAPSAGGARPGRRVPLAVGVAGLFLLAAVGLAGVGLRSAWGQASAAKQDTKPVAPKWTILFRSDDPSLWDTNTKGAAVPIDRAPSKSRYLRLRRMDTEEALILALTADELRNGGVPIVEKGYWWNGSAKEEWKGRHLGIVEAPRHKFPAPRGMISVMNERWDGFTGSGFGHKVAANDHQYYCWRGKEIPRTVFEIAVTPGPLTAEERRDLLRQK